MLTRLIIFICIIFLFACNDDSPQMKSLDENECCRIPPLVGCIGGATVFVPNAFTPNGDGYNDKLKPYYPEAIKQVIHFRVKDSTGEVLYLIENVPFQFNQNYGWDGTHPDGTINDAVYDFEVKVENIRNEIMEFTGKVCCRSSVPRTCIDLEDHCIYGSQWDGRGDFIPEIISDEPVCQ